MDLAFGAFDTHGKGLDLKDAVTILVPYKIDGET